MLVYKMQNQSRLNNQDLLIVHLMIVCVHDINFVYVMY